jgi:hypothetical protein
MPAREKTSRIAPEHGEILASEAAKHLGLTAQSIGQWTIKPGAPVRRVGTRVFVRWPEFARWRERELVQTAVRENAGPDLAAAVLRKAVADARRAELAADRQAGELAPVSEMDAAVERLASAVRNEVDGLRSRFTMLIVGLKTPQEAARVLDQMAAQILSGLADGARAMAEEDDVEDVGIAD